MARTSVAALELVFQTDLAEANLQQFINDASVQIDELAAADTAVSADVLELLERYYAAHLASSYDQRLKSLKSGETTASFQGKWGMKLESTDYGQKVLELDPSGFFASIGKVKPIIQWAGTATPAAEAVS